MASRSLSDHWRARAAEAMAKAERMHDADARSAMLQVAESYERLARFAERRDSPESQPR